MSFFDAFGKALAILFTAAALVFIGGMIANIVRPRRKGE